MKHLATAALLLLTATVSNAQGTTDSYERYLLPVATVHDVPGAFGSIWDSDVLVRNGGTEEIRIPLTGAHCGLGVCDPCVCIRVMPGTTVSLDDSLPSSTRFLNDVAAFLYVPQRGDREVDISVRIRNIAHAPSVRGTEIPVVHVSEFRAEVLTLLDVAVDPGSRTLIRINYPAESASSVPPAFRVRTFDLESDTPVEDAVVGSDYELHGPNGAGIALQTWPGFAEWAPRSNERRRLRIEISALDPSIPFWAFASITDNVTQEVAIATPQPRSRTSP